MTFFLPFSRGRVPQVKERGRQASLREVAGRLKTGRQGMTMVGVVGHTLYCIAGSIKFGEMALIWY